jgi:hypothetical protein
MSNSETDRIADQLRRAVNGPAWHGPSLAEAIDGVTAAQAEARPLPTAHTIHEVLAHAVSWLDIVRQRVDGRPPRVTEAMDWPPVGPAAWPDTGARLRKVAGEMDAVIRALDDRRLSEEIPVGSDRWTVYQTLHGTIQHVLYHAGQIAVLKKGLS